MPTRCRAVSVPIAVPKRQVVVSRRQQHHPPVRRAVIVGGIVVLLLGACTYGYVIWRNVEGRARAERACADTEAHVDDLLRETGDWLAMLASDPARAERLMRDAITGPCRRVLDELRWWRWSWGETLTVDMDPDEELGQVGQEIAQRCPDAIRRSFPEGLLGTSPDDLARDMCGQIESSLTLGGDTAQTRTLWEWVDELEAREEVLRPPSD